MSGFADLVLLIWLPRLKNNGMQVLLSAANGSRTETSVPPPGALPIVSVPPERVTISSHTARPMPLPRALELPL